jgi:hypothetical protein
MAMDDISDLGGRVFRIGSSYDLIVFDRLSLEEQVVLAELRADPDVYGVLRPRAGSGRTYRAIGKDAALLLLTLREPGLLPFFVWTGDEQAAAKSILDLVLDGVLEIEEAGRFVGGAAAAALFAGEQAGTPVGRLAQLSREAMLYAQSLDLNDADRLAARLYSFGRCPVTADWARQMQNEEASLAWLGASPGSDLRGTLDAEWRLADQGESAGWFAWRKTTKHGRRQTVATHKLYISPQLADVARSFAIVVDRLGRRDGAQFKIGRGAEGITRPDKIVAYFESLDALLDAADDLSDALAGIGAHGVPFSAEISRDGLLSWGMDPPFSDRAVMWQSPESWRQWVVRRLASAMVAAQCSGVSSLPPWQFAVERLRREGVDTERWTPSAAIWHAA